MVEEDFIIMHTDRLTIRDHRHADAASHHVLLSDPEVMYYLQDIMTDNFEKSSSNLQEAIEEISNPDRSKFFFRIEDRKTGEHIGEIGYAVTGYSKNGKIVNAGYFIKKEFWGNGYTAEAFSKLLWFAFMKGGVSLVETGCIKENVRSERVMQKCRLIREDGCLEEWHDGCLKERVQYRLTREEWLESRVTRILPS